MFSFSHTLAVKKYAKVVTSIYKVDTCPILLEFFNIVHDCLIKQVFDCSSAQSPPNFKFLIFFITSKRFLIFNEANELH